MELTQEKIEKVAQYANVSEAQAKQALEQCGGHQLEAVLLLEQEGRTRRPKSGVWSTSWDPNADMEREAANFYEANTSSRGADRKQVAREIVDAVANLVRNFTRITIDIWRGKDLLAGIPLIICILLFLVAPFVMIPLAIVGLLFLNCRYHISGWSFGEEKVNRAMDEVTDTVQDAMKPVHKHIEREINRYTREHRKDTEQNKK